jgi:AcrR family transcriptional regulator
MSFASFDQQLSAMYNAFIKTNGDTFMQILKDEVKTNIEKTALDIFVELGYEKTSMKQIADAAKVSVSNIYHYFDNKEKLYYAIVDPIYYQIDQLLKSFLENETGESFSDKIFIEQFTRFIVNAVAALIKTNRKQLLLLFDKSQGTKYENCKDRMVSFFEDHFINASKTGPGDLSFIMHLCATNLVEGLLEIVRHYKNDEWVNKAVNELMKYHICGTAPFFE